MSGANELAALRNAMKDALVAAGMDAHSTVPPKATPPVVYVAPDDPYVSPPGAAFGGEIVRHSVVLVAAAGVNEVKADELDSMILTAIDALDPHVDTYEVGRPGQISINGQGPFLAVAVSTSTEIHRER